MSQTITAIYANGVLRPLAPLPFADQTQVEVVIKQINGTATDHVAEHSDKLSSEPLPPPTPVEERERIHQALVAAGLVAERAPSPPPDPPLSDAERERLGRLLAQGGSLSELIIQERREGY